jgi:TolB protein
MLLRAYRVTDKTGVALLKTGFVLGSTAAAGAHVVVSGFGRVLGGIFGLIALVLGGLWWVVRRILGGVWRVLRLVLNAIGSVVMLFVGLAQGGARAASGTAGTAMARRAARAELETGLVEDPLAQRNRVLSGMVVVLVGVLLAIVLWATNPGRTPITGQVAAAGGANLFASTPLPATSVPLLATSVPTVTPLPSILEARGSLAYTVRENGQSDIWVVNIGDRTPIRLTNSPEDERDAVWSPDSRKLAYASRQDGNWELYIYDVQSAATARMTFDLSFQGAPQWSPDGQWLVYESYQGSNLDVYIMRVDGSQAERLTDHPGPDFSPAWSADGRRIAFVSWRDGNQDIHVFSLDDPRDAASVNMTNTPTRQEDNPSWSPDGQLLAFSAFDEGVEKIFVKPTNDPNAVAQVLGRGRAPTWSPDGRSLIAAVDSFDSTQLIAVPFTETGFATTVIPVPKGANSPHWTSSPLPASLVNSGGLGPAVVQPLFIEQEQETGGDPPYDLNLLVDVDAPVAALSDRVNDSFNALRVQTNEVVGFDFLGQLEDAFWPIDRLPQPGEPRRNWHMTGRAFAINRNAISGFPPPIEIVREDIDINTYWRIYVRVSDDAQNGELGEPLRQMPWDFLSRNQGDVEAYNQGGRLRADMPAGYYVDLTQLAADYGWEHVAAGTDWRANFNATNYWMFIKPEGLDWFDAMRELYTLGQMGGFAPTAVPPQAGEQPVEEPPADVQPQEIEVQPTLAEPTQMITPDAPLLPPPPTSEGDG